MCIRDHSVKTNNKKKKLLRELRVSSFRWNTPLYTQSKKKQKQEKKSRAGREKNTKKKASDTK